MKVVAVIPAYNEGKAIGPVIREVKKQVDLVVVVDDGSSDDTGTVAAENGAIVLQHIVNRGQGAALKTGTEFALGAGAQAIVHFDADGQQDPAEIKEMLQPVLNGQAEVVIGSRFLGRESNMPLSRRLLLKAVPLFTWVFSGINLTDPHNGFRVLSRQAAEKINISQDKMAHASEIIDEIARHKLKCVELPVTVRYTSYSMAKGQRNSAAFRVARDFLLAKFLGK